MNRPGRPSRPIWQRWRRELDNLIDGLATTGVSARVASAIKDREARCAQLERELSGLDQREHVSQFELARIEKLVRQKVEQWRTVMAKRTPQTRQLLSKILRERIVFVPETINGQKGYRFRAEASLLRVLAGTVPELSSAGSDGVPNPTCSLP